MARSLRIELAGGLYHVMCRGNERRAIFRDDDDRQRRLDWLQRMGKRVRTVFAVVAVNLIHHPGKLDGVYPLRLRTASTDVPQGKGNQWPNGVSAEKMRLRDRG